MTEVGLDHYYRDPAIDLKTTALAYLVLDELRQQADRSKGATDPELVLPNISR